MVEIVTVHRPFLEKAGVAVHDEIVTVHRPSLEKAYPAQVFTSEKEWPARVLMFWRVIHLAHFCNLILHQGDRGLVVHEKKVR